MNGASIILQQRAATRLLLLVCLLVLNCAAQPLARLALLDHAVSCQTLPQFASADDQADKGTPASVQPNSCQLNGKSLSAADLSAFIVLGWSGFLKVTLPSAAQGYVDALKADPRIESAQAAMTAAQ